MPCATLRSFAPSRRADALISLGPCRAACLIAALALIASFSLNAPAAEIDSSPLPLRVEPAFPDIQWPQWQAESDGVETPLRPIELTHAGNGSDDIFVATQRGVVYVLPAADGPRQAHVFLDISPLVAYHDKTNEEGLLGLAFHPQYRQNGRFFIYYTNRAPKHQNVVASFRVSSDDPHRADPNSISEILVLDKPYWNHDGGTIIFGPDGYLYVAVGDGGLANDPHQNGQNLTTLLGKILRLDVDHPAPGRPYGIPTDNPLANRDDARPEIWAYGLRNVWRMAFDRQTGDLWAADVGQDLWEEVDLITRGGNYGWNRREGKHPFAKSKKPSEATPELIDPIWEYHHDIGKSITGGFVYRGQQISELVGGYLYADYVSGRMWALFADPKTGQVLANREIPLPQSIPVLSFGADSRGEPYFLTYSATGQGIYRLAPAPAK